MKNYVLLVLSNSVERKDESFNDWYSNQHLKDVLAIPGIVAARRFQSASQPLVPTALYRYCATYEIETDDPQAVLDELSKRAGTGEMPLTDAMDPAVYGVIYEPLTPRITNSDP